MFGRQGTCFGAINSGALLGGAKVGEVRLKLIDSGTPVWLRKVEPIQILDLVVDHDDAAVGVPIPVGDGFPFPSKRART